MELVHLSNPEGLGVEEDLPLPGLHSPSPPPAQVSPDRQRALRAQRVEQPRVVSGSPVSLDPSLYHAHNGEVVQRAEKRKRCNTVSRMVLLHIQKKYEKNTLICMFVYINMLNPHSNISNYNNSFCLFPTG